MRKITPYNILKGLRYLKHFGPKEFWIRLRERLEPEEVPYGPWYEDYVLTGEELEKLRRADRAVGKDSPMFSVVVPLYKTPLRLFQEMAASVLTSTYPRLELLLVNASPEDRALGEAATELAKRDARVRVLDLKENLGIAGNTQRGIEAAAGDFITLLDHDDTIDPAALHFMAAYIGAHPDTGLLYTDEDKISEDGKTHFQPHLKPDYSPDLLKANNYICHFLAVRRDVAAAAGGFDGRFDGAQDHDFIFRCIDAAQRMGLTVGHVPEILYHWRVSAASTADNPMSKMYAYNAGKAAIEAQLAREGLRGEVSLRKDLGFYRVRYPVADEPLVSIVIPNRDEKETLARCIRSIREKSSYHNYEIIIVENNSATKEIWEYYRELERDEDIRVVDFFDASSQMQASQKQRYIDENRLRRGTSEECVEAETKLTGKTLDHAAFPKQLSERLQEIAEESPDVQRFPQGRWYDLDFPNAAWYASRPGAVKVQPGQFNYSALNNLGFSFARGEYVLLLNNDVEVLTPDWIEELLGVCQRPGTGAVGCKLLYPDGTIQHAGVVVGIGGIAGSMFVDLPGERTGYMHKADLMQDMSAVTAACMMVRTSAYREVGGFEERLSVAFNDVDFCLRLREAGYLVVYDPYARLTHWESKSRGKEDTKEKVRRFQSEIEYIRTRWRDILVQGDPYYNKNLSVSKWNYALRDKAHQGQGRNLG